MKNKIFLSVFLAVVFLFTITTKQTQAKWVDKSNQLPGMVSDGEMIALAAVATVGVGVLVYLLVKKKNQNQSATTLVNCIDTLHANSNEKDFLSLEPEKGNTIETSNSNIFSNSETSLMQKMETASRTIPVDVVVIPLASANNFAFGNTNGIQVGIRIRF